MRDRVGCCCFFKLILGKLESEILQRALWLFFQSISTCQCCSEAPAFISKVKVASRAVTLFRVWPGTEGMPFQAGDITAVFRWHIQVWRAMLSSFSYEAKNPEISARFHGNKEKKDWPTLLSNSEFQRPANWDQDQLPGLGTPAWGCLSVQDTVGVTARLLQETQSA